MLKRRQKAGFLSPRSDAPNHSNEGKLKDWRKRLRSEERERRRREKSNGCDLSFHNIYFGDLAITLSKIWLDIYDIK